MFSQIWDDPQTGPSLAQDWLGCADATLQAAVLVTHVLHPMKINEEIKFRFWMIYTTCSNPFPVKLEVHHWL